MKKYVVPAVQVYEMEMTASILANSFIDVGGNGTDHFDAPHKKEDAGIWNNPLLND